MKGKLPIKWLVGAAVIAVAALAIANLKFSDNVVYFYTPDEAIAKTAEIQGKTIKLGGMVQAGSVHWVPEDLQLDFIVTDMKGNDIKVYHKGNPPDMFKEMSGVVVEGRLAEDGRSIQSQKLMVKHSEEYKTPDATHSIDKELLEQSIFKGN